MDLTATPLGRTLFRLGAPVAAGAVLGSLYNLTDAYFLGKVGKEALSAPGVAMPFLFVAIAFSMGFGNAGAAMVAQYAGAGDYRRADRAGAQVILLVCGLTTVLALPMIFFPETLLLVFRVPEEVLKTAVPYFRLYMMGLPFLAFTIGYGAVLRALGDTTTVVVISACGNLVNIVLDRVLIFGVGGFEGLGATGAGLASLIAQSLAAVACMAALRRQRAGLEILRSDWKPDREMLGLALRAGLPAAIGNSSNSLGFAAFQVMVNTLGTTVIGAFTIGFRLIFFFHIPCQAMSAAATPIVGQALGAGKPALARRAVLVSAMGAALVMFIPSVFLMWQGKLVAGAFISDAEVIAESGRFFLVVPASAYFFGVLMVLMAAFYGSGHTRPAMAVSLVRVWVLRLPLAYVLGFAFSLGSAGIYYAMVVSNLASAALTLLLFRTTAWSRPIIGKAQVSPAATGK